MSFSETAVKFIEAWNVGETKIRRPSHLVFLCGGPSERGSPNAGSAREALLRALPDRERIGPARILLAEDANRMLEASTFDNLLDLEEYIAAVVDAVLIFVESAGSICELGAFTKTDEILRKMHAFIMNEHGINPSFIVNGPLKYLENIDGVKKYSTYHWKIEAGEVRIADYALAGIVAEATSISATHVEKEKYRITELGHRVLTILAITFMLRGGLISEIKECARVIWPSISETEVKKCLDTLRIAGLLKPVSNGPKRTHFIPLIDRINVDVTIRKGIPIRDPLRWLSDILDEIRAEDKVRLEIFQEHNDAA